MSGYVQSNQMVKLIAAGAVASYVVSPADSGKTILIPALGGGHALTINLPAVQSGLRYKFMASATLASAATITPTNGLSPYTPITGLINGSVINLPDGAAIDVIPKPAADTAILSATAVVGDYIEVNSDGVSWYVNGISSVAAGVA